MPGKKISVLELQAKKDRKEMMTMTAAYDYISGLIAERAGIDLVLVGDSVGMVLLGRSGTISVTMDEMIYHCKATVTSCKTPFVVGDMPFGSFQVSIRDAVENACKMMKESGVDAVKIEGGKEFAEVARAISDAGVPCMGHIGLTPQTISKLGGYKVQGRTADSATMLIEDALALEQAGCFAILLECIPAQVSRIISEKCKIPIFGIGAGPNVDGQSLVMHDVLGLLDRAPSKFVKVYMQGLDMMVDAMKQWIGDCKSGAFPAPENCFTIKDDELKRVY